MNFNLVPKVGESATEFDVIKDYLKDKVEIQILSTDFEEISKKVKACLEYKKLNLLIIHLPMEYTDWEVTLLDETVSNKFLKFVSDCIEYSKKFDTEIRILGHLNLRYEVIEHSNLFNLFKNLIKITENSKVGFLVENPVSEPYKAKAGEPFYKLVKAINHPKVRCCFDICHYSVVKSLLGDPYSPAKDLGEYVFSVHFSYFPTDKHVFEPDTHGIKHPDKEHILKDFKVLQKLGINFDTTYIVTEINEKDYTLKPDLLEELKNLTEIIKN